jgi:hypothetical protein
MTRPFALIEGDLALPNARLLHGLPPPFGSQRRAARVASPRRTQPVPAAAQQAIQNVVRHKTPLRRSPLPPGTMFRFFYKVKQPRDYSAHINAQLAEARHYLEAGKKRECSSRSDYVLGAAIFAVTSIALAWLLTTGVMREAEKAVTVAIARPVELLPQQPNSPTQPAAEVAQTVVQSAPSANKPSLRNTSRREPVALLQAPRLNKPMPARDAATRRAASANTAHTGSRVKRVKEAELNDRLALSRSARPSTQPPASKQPEWTARVASTDVTAEQAALRDWAVQQRRATVTTRASVSTTPGEANWNAGMSHRRITDSPDAFVSNTAQH